MEALFRCWSMNLKSGNILLEDGGWLCWGTFECQASNTLSQCLSAEVMGAYSRPGTSPLRLSILSRHLERIPNATPSLPQLFLLLKLRPYIHQITMPCSPPDTFILLFYSNHDKLSLFISHKTIPFCAWLSRRWGWGRGFSFHSCFLCKLFSGSFFVVTLTCDTSLAWHLKLSSTQHYPTPSVFRPCSYHMVTSSLILDLK